MNQVQIEQNIEIKHSSSGRNLRILAFAAFVRMLGVSIIDLILISYAINLGGNTFSGGIAAGCFSIAQVLFQIPIAKLSDRIGRKNTILIGMGIFATGTFLCGLAQNIYQLILFRFLQGSGAFISVIQAFIGDLFPSKKRGKAMSIYTSGVTLGYAIGLPLGGFFASLFLNLPFFVHFGLIMVSWILIYFFIDEINVPLFKSDDNDFQINYKEEIFKNKLFLFTTLVDCLSVFVFASLLFFIQKFAESLGIDIAIFSLAIIPLVLLMTLGFYIGGKYSDLFGRSNMILTGLIIAGIMILMQCFVTTLIELIIVAGITVFGIGIAWPTIPALIIDSVSERCRATATSIYNSFRYFSNALGPIIIGFIIIFHAGVEDPTPLEMAPGIRISYLISGILYFIAVLLVIFFVRKYEKERRALRKSKQ